MIGIFKFNRKHKIIVATKKGLGCEIGISRPIAPSNFL